MIAKLETEGQCRILRVSGRIDFESALDFEQQINSMIQQDADCFIIELSEVELLSSAGLRVLLSTAKRVSHRDASLGLAAQNISIRVCSNCCIEGAESRGRTSYSSAGFVWR